MASLFISYSRRDIESARTLTEAFKTQDLDFWIDWEGIPPTVNWWKEIEKGIEEADIFLFLISPDSCKSKVCKQEIDCAVRNGKRLIPLVVRDVTGDDAPDELSELNWIFFRASDDFAASFEKLMLAIHTDYAWVQAHRQLQLKALEWERNDHENSFLLRGRELQDAESQLTFHSTTEPHPTELQRTYALRSRQATDRQRRITSSLVTIAGVALVLLSFAALFQADRATREANVARTAQANAMQEADARATAQKIAETQRDIAYAGRLSLYAQKIGVGDEYYKPFALFVAIESMRLNPSNEAAAVLNEYTLTPIAETENIVDFMAFSPDGRYLTWGGYGMNVAHVWDLQAQKEVASAVYEGGVSAVAFSPDSRYMISASSDGFAQILDINAGTATWSPFLHGTVNSIGFTKDSAIVLLGAGVNVYAWEPPEDRIRYTVEHLDNLYRLVSSPKTEIAVSGIQDGTIVVWDTMDGRILDTYRGDAFSLSQSGKYLAYANPQSNITWVKDLATKRVVFHNDNEYTTASSLAVSPDDRYLAQGGSDYVARVWDLRTGRLVAGMQHELQVVSVQFSPDGKYVMSRSLEGNVRVWETQTGREVARLPNEDRFTTTALSPDGTFVASSQHGRVAIWSVDQLEQACQSLPADFDPLMYELDLAAELSLEQACPGIARKGP